MEKFCLEKPDITGKLFSFIFLLDLSDFGPGLSTTSDLAKWVKKPQPPKQDLELHRIYMISLVRRKERRARMRACFQELDISVSVYDAVDAM